MTLADLERLYAEATRGPWLYCVYHWGAGDVIAPGYGKSSSTNSWPELAKISPDHTYISVAGDQVLPCDGDLIAAMHAALPDLIAVAKRAKELSDACDANGENDIGQQIIALDTALSRLTAPPEKEAT